MQTKTIIIAVVESWCAAFDTKRRAKSIGNKATKKLSFRENGCKEPINENIKPLSADKNENKYNKIKNSTSTYILVLVTTLPIKKIKSIPEVMNKFGMSTEKNWPNIIDLGTTGWTRYMSIILDLTIFL